VLSGDYSEGGQHVLTSGHLLAQRYEVLSLLGEGGMGAVYKARDVELGRMVALKVIRPDLARNRAILDRFKQELILATQVTHRNVVRIYDLGEAEGSAMWIVGWTSVAVGIAALGLYVGRELRARYKFNHRTQYDFFSHAGDSVCAADYGTGI